MYNFKKSCVYCKNLIDKDGFMIDFECGANKYLQIKNAGACFVVVTDSGDHVILEDCCYFEEKEK